MEERACQACGSAKATQSVGQGCAAFSRMCEPCADQAIACSHEDGWLRHKEFDSEGCGFYLQRCNRCSVDIFDDMP